MNNDNFEKYYPIGATISAMILFAFNDFDYFFGNNFFSNLFSVLLWVAASFFAAGIAMILPAIIIHYTKESLSSNIENTSESTLKTIKIVSAIIIWIVLAVVVTLIGEK